MTLKYDRLNGIPRCGASAVKYRQRKINFLLSPDSLARLFRTAPALFTMDTSIFVPSFVSIIASRSFESSHQTSDVCAEFQNVTNLSLRVRTYTKPDVINLISTNDQQA